MIRSHARSPRQRSDAAVAWAAPRPGRSSTARRYPGRVQTPTVLVVDYGAQYAQLIARRVREAQVYSEIVPATRPVAEIVARKPAAVILSGGPASVYAEGAPAVDPALFDRGHPGARALLRLPGDGPRAGRRGRADGTREYGRTELCRDRHRRRAARRAAVAAPGVDEPRRLGRRARPEGFTVTASSERAAVAAFEDTDRRLAGVQYHPEVGHSPHGQEVLRRFLHDDRRHPARAGPPRRSSTRRSTRSARRSATAGRSAGCPAGSTPRSPPRSCSAPSATG